MHPFLRMRSTHGGAVCVYQHPVSLGIVHSLHDYDLSLSGSERALNSAKSLGGLFESSITQI
jgi:hypothetical protein